MEADRTIPDRHGLWGSWISGGPDPPGPVPCPPFPRGDPGGCWGGLGVGHLIDPPLVKAVSSGSLSVVSPYGRGPVSRISRVFPESCPPQRGVGSRAARLGSA